MTDSTTGQATLLVLGDVNLQERSDPAEAFALVADDFSKADATFANMEMCLYRADETIPDKPYWVQSDRSMVKGLVSAGFSAVGTANNVNYGSAAILSTIETLDENGIGHAGTGADHLAARAPVIVERNGVRFGFLSRTAVFFPHGHAATVNDPGVATIKIHTAYEPNPRSHELPAAPPIVRSWPDRDELELLREDVRTLRGQVDVLVTNFHWGVSQTDEVVEYQRTVAHDMIDNGADLVVGSHAHLPQAAEIYKDRFIFYGLGNFAFDWPEMAKWRTGLAVELAYADSRIVRVSARPVIRHDDQLNQPEILSLGDAEGDPIVRRLVEASEPFGARFDLSGPQAVLWKA